MDILMTKKVQVSSINKKTTAVMFKNVQVGDVIEFSVPIIRAGIGRGTHASYICSKNMRTEEKGYHSFNQLPKILKVFEFDEVNTSNKELEFEKH